jgi:uncharacterized protein GlcG (DUF336 family)
MELERHSVWSAISLDLAQAAIHAAVAEAKKRDWKMNATVVEFRRQPAESLRPGAAFN